MMFGFLHLQGMIFLSIYGFFKKFSNQLDKLYLIIFIIIPLSWVFFKNECIISYYIKKYNNPEYILGSQPNNIDDITELFPNKLSYEIFFHINHILRIISFKNVLFRVNYEILTSHSSSPELTRITTSFQDFIILQNHLDALVRPLDYKLERVCIFLFDNIQYSIMIIYTLYVYNIRYNFLNF